MHSDTDLVMTIAGGEGNKCRFNGGDKPIADWVLEYGQVTTI